MSQEKIYAGSGKIQTGQYGEFYKISVCLDDIPAEYITTAKNGKRYVNLNVNKKKETDQYGKNLSVQVDTWKPEQSGASFVQNVVEDAGDKLPF